MGPALIELIRLPNLFFASVAKIVFIILFVAEKLFIRMKTGIRFPETKKGGRDRSLPP
jgi:hypothetical protein